MSSALAAWAVRHRRLVLVVTVLLVVAALPLAAKQQDRLTSGGTVSSSSQSATVSRELEAGVFPGAEVAPLAVVLQPRADARPDDLRKAIAEVDRRLDGSDGVTVKAAGRRMALVSATARPRTPVALPLNYGGGVGIDQARDATKALGIPNPDAGSASDGRVAVHLAGEGSLWAAFIQRASDDTKAAESRGLPITLIVLLVAFGSLAAAVLPLAVGATAVVVTGAIIYLLSFATHMDVFASTTASMIGLGVAIDYSLFILVRYREEVAAGHSHEVARERAMATSGRAVVYSGLTVAIAQAALFLIPSPGIRSIGAGTIIVVGASVLISMTLLPVLISLLGRRAHEPGYVGRFLARRRARSKRETIWIRWTAVVMRHPVVCLVTAVVALLALASPVLGLEVRNSAAGQLPATNQAREGITIAGKLVGEGALAPAQIVLRSPDGRPLDRPTIQRAAAAVRADPAVEAVSGVQTTPDGRRALVTAPLRVASDSPAARDAVDRLRDTLPAKAPGAEVDVGGTTATILDFDRLVTDQLWKPMLFVLATSFVVLLILLRSIVLPIKATLMNALSVLASYGALVGVFQHGWLEFLGIDRAPSIYPITLPLVLTLCFGLSMDYHIFMLSRIQERYAETGDTRRAVGEALATSAAPITSAALIMVVVFLAFVSAGAPSIQQLGFAAAVAIAIDATIVRLVIVPAAMELLGDRNWWLPRPLARILPRGAAHAAPLPAEERLG